MFMVRPQPYKNDYEIERKIKKKLKKKGYKSYSEFIRTKTREELLNENGGIIK